MYQPGEPIILTKDVLYIGKGTPAIVIRMSKPGRTVYAKLADGTTFSCSVDCVVSAKGNLEKLRGENPDLLAK